MPRSHARRSAAPYLEPSLSSLYSPQPIEQDTSFLIIGERTNANGSKAFRDAMLASDWDAGVRMAGDQIREGAHVLDVCVDYVGRDGAVDMDDLASRLATQASVPLVLDSTEPPVMEAGLRAHRRPAPSSTRRTSRTAKRRRLALRPCDEPRARSTAQPSSAS